MTSIEFQDVPELLGKIASSLDGSLEESRFKSHLSIENKNAKGYISTYDVIDGLEMMVCDITFIQGFQCVLKWNQPQYLLFHLCALGSIEHRFDDQTDFQKLEFQQNTVIRNRKNVNNILRFPKGTALRTSTIFISSHKLKSLELKQRSYLQNDLLDLFSHFKEGKHFCYRGGISPYTANLVEELVNVDDRNVAGRIQVKSLIINILASQIIKHNRDMAASEFKSPLRKIDLDKIRGLAQFISDNISEPLHVSALYRLSGLSPKKLQNGFNFLYDKSVNRFIRDVRLKIALQLMESTEYNVSEVCYRVGINSRSYFSQIFKEKYGVRPIDYRNSIGGNLGD